MNIFSVFNIFYVLRLLGFSNKKTSADHQKRNTLFLGFLNERNPNISIHVACVKAEQLKAWCLWFEFWQNAMSNCWCNKPLWNSRQQKALRTIGCMFGVGKKEKVNWLVYPEWLTWPSDTAYLQRYYVFQCNTGEKSSTIQRMAWKNGTNKSWQQFFCLAFQ